MDSKKSLWSYDQISKSIFEANIHSRKRSNVFGDAKFWFCPNPIKFAQVLSFAQILLLGHAAASPSLTALPTSSWRTLPFVRCLVITNLEIIFYSRHCFSVNQIQCQATNIEDPFSLLYPSRRPSITSPFEDIGSSGEPIRLNPEGFHIDLRKGDYWLDKSIEHYPDTLQHLRMNYTN